MILRDTHGRGLLTGREDSDWLYGLGGDDRLFGNGGDDYITGGPGADHIYGGPGQDTALYDDSPVGVIVNLVTGQGSLGTAERDTLDSIENLIGSTHNDRLIGNDETNGLAGGYGGDLLFGGGGIDVLDGGFGGDTLNGGADPDYLYGGPGIDTASYEDSPDGVDIDLEEGTGQGGDAEGDIIDGIENVLGSLHNDILTGNDEANRLEGLDGRDLLIGNGGADYLYGNLGGDILDGGRGADHLFGGHGDDMLRGGAGGDHLDGGPEIDTVWYGLSVLGVQLNLEAGLGFAGEALGDVFVSIENVFGSLRGDIIVGSIEANVIEGATGSDYIVGDAGDDHLFGGYAPATIAAGDVVFLPGDTPSDGDDTLVGGPGDDTLNGGFGADTLTGGRDADTFVWRDIHESGLTAETMDLIKDFNFSERDKIGLHAIDAVEATTDINEDFTFIGTADFSTAGQIRYYQDGTDTFIALNTNGDLAADAVIRIAGLRTPDALWFNP